MTEKARVVIDVSKILAASRPRAFHSPEEARKAAMKIRLDFERRTVDPFAYFKRRYGDAHVNVRHKTFMELSAATYWEGDDHGDGQVSKPQAV